MIRRSLALGLILAAATAVAVRPTAASKRKAKQLYDEAVTGFATHKYRVAAEKFIKSYEMSGRAELLWNAARCYELLNEPVLAAHFYRQYLEQLPDTPKRADVEAKLKQYETPVGSARPAPASPPVVVEASAPSPPGPTQVGPREAPPLVALPLPTPATAVPPAAVAPPEKVRRVEPPPSRAPWYLLGGAAAVSAAAGAVLMLLPGEESRHEREVSAFALLGAAGALAVGVGWYLITTPSSIGAEVEGAGVAVNGHF